MDVFQSERLSGHLNRSSWPGLPRPSTSFSDASKNVDTRHKAGMT